VVNMPWLPKLSLNRPEFVPTNNPDADNASNAYLLLPSSPFTGAATGVRCRETGVRQSDCAPAQTRGAIQGPRSRTGSL